VREALDRLREAETALDRHLSDFYFLPDSPDRTRVMTLLWKAKKSIWHAQMCVLDAAAGHRDPDST